MENTVFNRSYQNLSQKFLQYLFPTMMTTVALSLNEFVDSMLVANLLGSHAMAIVNLGFPVMLLMATLYTLFGTGGATLYAVALGERNPGKAGKALCLSLLAAGILGGAITAAGLLLPDVLLPVLCQDPGLFEDFSRYYLQVLGEKRYAMAVSLFDGFAGLVPMTWLLCRFMGIDGLLWAYPLNSILLLLGILLWNLRLSGGRYRGLLLTEQEDAAIQKQDFTMTGEKETISKVSRQVAETCESWGLKSGDAKLVGLMLEEMAVYSKRHHRIVEDYDVLLRLYDDHVEIDFRSLGDSCNPLQDTELDDHCNMAYLRKISAALDYDYIMGMNSTHIVLEKG